MGTLANELGGEAVVDRGEIWWSLPLGTRAILSGEARITQKAPLSDTVTPAAMRSAAPSAR
jgi:hypothetical protein